MQDEFTVYRRKIAGVNGSNGRPYFWSSPAQHGYGGGSGDPAMAARVRAKLDFVSTKVNHEGEEEEAEKVKGSLDRLAFASQVSNVQNAFGSIGHDALDEVGEGSTRRAAPVESGG